MGQLDTFDDVRPMREWNAPEGAESSWSEGLWDQARQDAGERAYYESSWSEEGLWDQERQAAADRAEADALRREGRLRKLADRILWLRFLNADAKKIAHALERYFEEWRGVRPQDLANLDPGLVALSQDRLHDERQKQYWRMVREQGVLTSIDVQRQRRSKPAEALERLLDAAGLEGRDREIGLAMRTYPFPTLKAQSERFGVSAKRVHELEHRIRAKCQEAAVRLGQPIPEWTKDGAPRRPGGRGPARTSRVTVSRREAA